jgi:hypothetical protein
VATGELAEAPRDSARAGQADRSPIATQLRPWTPYMRNALRVAEQELLSPRRPGSLIADVATIASARASSSGVGSTGSGGTGRRSARTATKSSTSMAPAVARIARGAVAWNSNCHQSSCA